MNADFTVYTFLKHNHNSQYQHNNISKILT